MSLEMSPLPGTTRSMLGSVSFRNTNVDHCTENRAPRIHALVCLYLLQQSWKLWGGRKSRRSYSKMVTKKWNSETDTFGSTKNIPVDPKLSV